MATKPLVSEVSHPDLPQLPKPGDETLGTLFGAMHSILWDLEHGRARDLIRDYVQDVICRTGVNDG